LLKEAVFVEFRELGDFLCVVVVVVVVAAACKFLSLLGYDILFAESFPVDVSIHKQPIICFCEIFTEFSVS